MSYQPILAWQMRSDERDRRDRSAPRALGAGATSLALHLSIAALIWIASGPLMRLAARASTMNLPVADEPRNPTVTFVASPADVAAATRSRDEAAADKTPFDLGIHLDDDAAMLRLRGFEFDVGKLTSRASTLF